MLTKKSSSHSLYFLIQGPESPVIKWFLDKKMVITAFRKVSLKQDNKLKTIRIQILSLVLCC